MAFFGFEGELLVLVSLVLIAISVIVILASVLLIFFLKRRTIEDKHVEKILSEVELLKQGKKVALPHKSSELEIGKAESSLKNLLIKKFKPKIESQLGAKVNIIDFNAKSEKFLALCEIAGVRVVLTLDSAGKILDYKKVKA